MLPPAASAIEPVPVRTSLALPSAMLPLPLATSSGAAADSWAPATSWNDHDGALLSSAGDGAVVLQVAVVHGVATLKPSDRSALIVTLPTARTVSSPSYSIAIAFPKQSHTLAEIAGNWNNIALQTINPTNNAVIGYVGTTGTVTLSAAGQLSNVTWCQWNTPRVRFVGISS